MSYPNNNCGSCSVWLGIGEPENHTFVNDAIKNHSSKCEVFLSQKFVRHIPSGCCYPLEEDGKTVIICGAHLDPAIDGKIFWEYVDKYEEKIIKPSDPYANH